MPLAPIQAAGSNGPEGPPPKAQDRPQFRGGQRQMSMLNPEISVTGDFLGAWHRGASGDLRSEQGFFLRAVELNIVAPLDPFTRGRFFLEVDGDGTFIVDEAYMEWLGLPGGLTMKTGIFRAQFGQLNRWHEHALPQIDRPLVLDHYFGEDPLGGPGVGGNWMFLSPLAHVHEFTLEYFSQGEGTSFVGEPGRHGVTGARLLNYYDLSMSTYVEMGVSAADGRIGPDGAFRNTLTAMDLNFKWAPPGRAGYRTVEARAELFSGRRDSPTGLLRSLGGYAYMQGKLGARWWVGVRADHVQDPVAPDDKTWATALDFTFWQSEFVFYRLQVANIGRNFDTDYHRLMLQACWSMGPHKHEAY